jgi:hypothetical protein
LNKRWENRNNQELRKTLHDITEDKNNRGKQIRNQVRLIAALASKYPHSIILEEEAVPGLE